MSSKDGGQLKANISKLLDDGVALSAKLECLNNLVQMSSSVEENTLASYCDLPTFACCIRLLLSNPTRTIRTTTLRTTRYYVKDESFLEELVSHNVSFFVAKSLERQDGIHPERMQALKLIRSIMEFDCRRMPLALVRPLIAVAETSQGGGTKDQFSRCCLETLCEIALLNPKVVSEANGMKTLFAAVVNPDHQSLQSSLISAILYLFNELETRQYIRPNSDLRVMLAPLTDTFIGKEEGAAEKKEREWSACCKAICGLVTSWTGLLVLASDKLGLKSMVDALYLPSLRLHDIVLDGLFEIFRLAMPTHSPFHNLSGRRSASASISLEIGVGVGLDLPSRTLDLRPNPLNTYMAVLLTAFIDCGIIEALVHLGRTDAEMLESIKVKEFLAKGRGKGQGEGEDVSRHVAAHQAMMAKQRIIESKATVLLGELLLKADNLIPVSRCASLQTLPSLINSAITFGTHAQARAKASTMVSNLHQYANLRAPDKVDIQSAINITGANKWRRLKGRDRRLDRIDDVKRKIEYGMDDKELQVKLTESQVLMTKEYARWRWELISELVEGPLRNPHHLKEAMTRTKFIKRILSFLRPSNRLFSTMAWTPPDAAHYGRVACQVLELLVQSDAGTAYLASNAFLTQISELLKIEAEGDRRGTKLERFFSPDRILKTMAREYFTMMGTLSSYPKGLELMRKFGIFSFLPKCAQLQGREDLSKLILTSLDYNMAGHSRVLLQKSLKSKSKVVRCLAARHLGVLLRSGVEGFSAWGINYCVSQFADEDAKVSQIALSILDEACDEVSCLDSLISKKPLLLEMGQQGKDLVLRFLSRESGFRFLQEMKFIDDEMQLWEDDLNRGFVYTVEAMLDKAFSASVWQKDSHTTKERNGVVNLPPHFFGELAKTAMGCEMLDRSRYIPSVMESLRRTRDPVEQRAYLWVLGCVGASESGLQFLQKNKAIRYILELVQSASSLSLRGTCFYIISLISRTEAGKSALLKMGWETDGNTPTNVCIPVHLGDSRILESVCSYEFKGSWAANSPIAITKEYEEDDLRHEVLKLVSNLGSNITLESASKSLKKMRTKQREVFASEELFWEVLKMLEAYTFRLRVRRFLYDLFDQVRFTAKFLNGTSAALSTAISDAAPVRKLSAASPGRRSSGSWIAGS